jgi:hypothetical protein
MIEAKGNYADLLATAFGRERLEEDWLDQAGKQVRASQGRRIEWYFHDAAAATVASALFVKRHYDSTITVHVLPYPGGVPKPNPRVR